MKKLLLIRHAETDYTEQKRYCGHRDIAINSKGRKQALKLRRRLDNIKIDNIYSSDLKRAYETARILFPNRNILKRKALREIDFGEFCGFTWEEASRLYPDIYETLINDPRNASMPKGESILSFAKRVKTCFNKLVDENRNKTIALVSHGGPIRIILLELLKQGLENFWNIEQATAAVNIITFKKGKPKIAMLNDVSYLR